MRALIVFGALLLGLIGLFMSLCGGGFVIGALLNFHDRSSGSIAAIAIPCALIGVGLIAASVRLTRRAAEESDEKR